MIVIAMICIIRASSPSELLASLSLSPPSPLPPAAMPRGLYVLLHHPAPHRERVLGVVLLPPRQRRVLRRQGALLPLGPPDLRPRDSDLPVGCRPGDPRVWNEDGSYELQGQGDAPLLEEELWRVRRCWGCWRSFFLLLDVLSCMYIRCMQYGFSVSSSSFPSVPRCCRLLLGHKRKIASHLQSPAQPVPLHKPAHKRILFSPDRLSVCPAPLHCTF